ncbi:MarR family transcriptional regulator, partial [Streptomyces hainanensis]
TPAPVPARPGPAALAALVAEARERHPGAEPYVLCWGSVDAGTGVRAHRAAESVGWPGTVAVAALLELRQDPHAARPMLDSLLDAARSRDADRPGPGPLAWSRPAAGAAHAPAPRAPRAFDQMALGSFNEKLVIETIREARALSRVEIAERTGLTPQAVSRIARNLLASGLLVEDAHQPGHKGKPRVPLRLRADAACAVGIHLDPEMVTQVVVDLCGEVLDQRRLPLHGNSEPEWVIDAVARLAREAVAARRPSP